MGSLRVVSEARRGKAQLPPLRPERAAHGVAGLRCVLGMISSSEVQVLYPT